MKTKVLNFDSCENLLSHIAKEKSKIFFCIDESLLQFWPSFFLEISHLKNALCILLPGEEKHLKSFRSYEEICERLIKSGVTRNDLIVAIGGGALSDVVGFAAGTVLRGIRWSVVPTTLLSMVDASIGGKTGINLSSGKNLVGIFHFPEEVLTCVAFLQSLDNRQVQSGMGEVLKYGLLSKEVYYLIKDKASLQKIIMKCQSFKQEIVEKDCYDGELRHILNLGHTLAHAFELVFSIAHGDAVSLGIEVMFKGTDLEPQILDLQKGLGITREKELSFQEVQEKLLHYIQHDKKKTKQKIKEVFLRGIGDYYFQEVTFTYYKEVLEKC